MTSSPEATPRVLLVVVAQRNYDHWEQLDQIEAAAQELVEVLCKPNSRFQWELPRMLHGGTAPKLVNELGQWLAANVTEKDRLILYWTGHATRTSGFYFLLGNSPREGLDATNAILPEVLANVVGNCRAEKKIFFIDTCYSGAGADDFVRKIHDMFAVRTFSPGQTPYIGVIPSAHSLQKAKEAVFCRVLREVLTATDAKSRTWDDDDEWISAGALRDALYQALEEQVGAGWQPPLPFTAGYGERFVPNPRYRVNLRLDVETSRKYTARLQIPEALRLAGRGVVRGETGLYFTGRRAVTQKLTSWLRQPGPGLAVLTGPPGAGKSAVLGRLVLAADASFKAEAAMVGLEWVEDVVSTSNNIAAVVHVRGKTDDETAHAIAEQLFPDWAKAPTELEELLQELRTRPEKGAIIVDALDEAATPFAIGTLIRRLVEEGSCRILVGTRRSPDGHVAPAAEERHERLRKLFGEAAELTDLEDDTQTDADIAGYVRQRLRQSHHAAAVDGIEQIAMTVAIQAQGNFLYARIVARTLQEAQTLERALPFGPVAALMEDIQQRFPQQAAMVNGLFRGLAWAEGEGVSRRSLPALASALTNGETQFTAADVEWALDNVGWHILQGQEDGQTVFRLVHQAFTDHYRQQPASYNAVHREIAKRLSHGIKGLGWLDADPYIHRYLAIHARRGGLLASYIKDVGYLVTAKPGPLISRLYGLEDSIAQRMAGIYRRAVHGFFSAGMPERMALLELVARQNDSDLVELFKPLLLPRWQSLWVYWRAAVPSVTVASLKDAQSPAAVCSSPDPYGSPLLITATGRELWGWELEQLRETPHRALLEGNITTITIHGTTGTSYAVVGSDRGELAVFSIPDLARLEYRGDAFQCPVRELVTVDVNETPYIAAIDAEQNLSLWAVHGLHQIACGTRGTPPDASLITTTWHGNPVIVTSGDAVDGPDRNPIRIWSVPGLSLLESFGEQVVCVGRMESVKVGRETILLGARWNKVFAWKLETREQLSINALGRMEDETVGAQYFLPVRTEPSRAKLILTYYAQLCLLTIEENQRGIELVATPWVEADYGHWLGPIRLWRGDYAVSVHREIRVWNLRDLFIAVGKAPADYEAMYRWQLSFGFPSIAAGPGQLFAARDSGSAHCFDAISGQTRWEQALNDRPLKICFIDTPELKLVAVAAKHSIRVFDSSGPHVVHDLSVTEEIRDMQVVNFGKTQCLAVLMHTEETRNHRVALLRHSDLGEIDTRDSRGHNRFFWGGSDRHICTLAAGEMDNGQVIIVGGESLILVWSGLDFGELLLLRPWPSGRAITSIAVLPHAVGSRFVIGMGDGAIALIACVQESCVVMEQKHGVGPVMVAVVTWCGQAAIASGGSEGKLRFWTLDLYPLEEIDLRDRINQIVGISPEMVAVATIRGIVVLRSSGAKVTMRTDGSKSSSS